MICPKEMLQNTMTCACSSTKYSNAFLFLHICVDNNFHTATNAVNLRGHCLDHDFDHNKHCHLPLPFPYIPPAHNICGTEQQL